MHDQDYEKAYAKQHNAIEPLYSWTPTIAPAGLDYYNSDNIPEWKNSLLLTTLKGKSLRLLKLNEQGDKVVDEKIYLENVYGRIRDLCISPEGDIYISTSNRDWNPMIEPTAIDDRILRIARVEKADKTPLKAKDMELEKLSHQTGEVLYQKYCLACHKLNGKGLEGTFPSLAGSKIVANAKDFIPFVLKGSDKGMPSFKFLNDEELGKILTFVGSSWGNKTDSISADEVERVR
jgi:mono/diheme cytochrome c family protein